MRTVRGSKNIERLRRSEPSQRGWLGTVFGDSDKRRLLLAFALAIGLHEILAGLIPGTPRASTQRELVTHVQLAHISVATPTPPPTPTPPRASRMRTIAPAETHVVRNTTTGVQARTEIVRRAGAARPKPPVFSHAKPIWDIPVGAAGAGAGNRAGAGGGSGISGSGAGNRGSGNGAAGGSEPCGFVEFSDPHGSRFDPRTRGFWVDIRLSVHFPDGHADSLLLDYPWYYADEASNPWSNQNLNDPKFPTTFQSPPADKLASEPALVQYVIAHTGPGGYTLLKDCPAAKPGA